MEEELILAITVYCEVAPLMRPRFNVHTKSVYQPKDNQKPLLSALQAYVGMPSINHPVVIDTEIIIARGKSKTAYPRGDVDNMLKSVLDGLVHVGILKDDDLVVKGTVSKAFGQESLARIDIRKIAV